MCLKTKGNNMDEDDDSEYRLSVLAEMAQYHYESEVYELRRAAYIESMYEAADLRRKERLENEST